MEILWTKEEAQKYEEWLQTPEGEAHKMETDKEFQELIKKAKSRRKHKKP